MLTLFYQISVHYYGTDISSSVALQYIFSKAYFSVMIKQMMSLGFCSLYYIEISYAYLFLMLIEI